MRSALLLLCAAATCLIAPSSARACSCNPSSFPWTATKALEQSAVTFSGRVIAIRRVRGEVAVTFSVGRVWKGDVDSRAKVFVGHVGGVCNYPFERGKAYLVYARGEGKLETSQCFRTQPLFIKDLLDEYPEKRGYASEDLRELGAGKPPISAQPNNGMQRTRESASPLSSSLSARR